jgi:hypothetical protein
MHVDRTLRNMHVMQTGRYQVCRLLKRRTTVICSLHPQGRGVQVVDTEWTLWDAFKSCIDDDEFNHLAKHSLA